MPADLVSREAAGRAGGVLVVAGEWFPMQGRSTPSELVVTTYTLPTPLREAMEPGLSREATEIAGYNRAAAARVAALAARLLAAETGLSGASLKARILALARQGPYAMYLADIGKIGRQK